MLFWPREGSQREFGQLGIWLQIHLLQIHPSNWMNNVQVETHQGQCFVFKCLTEGSSEIHLFKTLMLIRHLVMVFRKSQVLREEESYLEHNDSAWRLRPAPTHRAVFAAAQDNSPAPCLRQAGPFFFGKWQSSSSGL